MSPYIVLGLVLLLSIFVTPASSATATSGDAGHWSAVSIPTEGAAGNWVLAGDSDIQHLTVAIGGTLYAYGKGLSYTLLKSTDGGGSWSYTGAVQDSIVGIAASPNDANFIYYATASNVYKSADAGNSFALLLPNPGGAGTNNLEITSIDVTYLGYYLVAVGTRDSDSGQYGGIYILDESMSFTWADTSLGNYDVYAVAFSPDYPTDRQLVAVVTDETNTLVTTKFGDGGWGATIAGAGLDRDNSGIPTPVAAASADIAFPDGYNADAIAGSYTLFVAIDTGVGNGDVYRINGSTANDLNIGAAYGLSNVDVTSLAVTGSTAAGSLLAGTSSGAQVYFTTDGGISWTRSAKEPTGQAKTFVVMTPDFSNRGKAYAATSGTESAFSCTADGGVTWNQLSLIDTRISDIVDLAPSPSYGQDNTLFMLTWGGEHSLWRSLNGGASWQRVYSSALANVDSIKRVALSPQYSNGSQVVFIAGNSGGQPAVWSSTDNGQNFAPPQVARDPLTGATFLIDAWVVANNSTLFVGSYDGSHGLVYRTANSGWVYSTGVVVGNQSLSSITLSPNYDHDGAILVGNTAGWVYWSNDNGASFYPLPSYTTSPPLTGSVSVAFGPQFSSNNTVYAASDNQNEGIYRFIIGTSTSWEKIDSTLPADGMIGQLKVSADGVLYATNFKANGGMERSINPTYPVGPTFETVAGGLDAGATLSGLWLCDHRLWSIDTTNARLMTYSDRLAQPVSLISPSDGASGIGTLVNYKISDVSLDWQAIRGTTGYKWQVDYDTDFSGLPVFEGDTQATSVRLPPLEPGTTYCWWVRATGSVSSRWSATWSFTTRPGFEALAPTPISPQNGASGVELNPLFQWLSLAGADSYELLVATNDSFAEAVVVETGDNALATTAWQCDANLDYDTTHYWKVRGTGSGNYSAWSATSVFATKLPPVQSEPVPAPESSSPAAPESSSPPPPASLISPDWVKWLMYLGGAFVSTMVATLIVVIILTVKVWRF